MSLLQDSWFDGGNTVMKKAGMLYTIADLDALQEGERAELIEGKLYMMSAPSATHQDMVGFIYSELRRFFKEGKGKCKAFVAPFAVFLNETDTYVEPDIIVICDEERYDEKGCHGAPDLVIEVVSPGSARMDYAVKLFKYRSFGVREYWIVDPDKKRIQVYDFEHDNMEEYTFVDKVPVKIYEGSLEIDFTML